MPSPVTGHGIALACGPKQSPVYAIKLGGQGTLDHQAVAWESPQREISSDVATPLYYQDHFFILNGDRDFLAKVDPRSGQPSWTGQFDQRTKIESSPTGADGKIVLKNEIIAGLNRMLETGKALNVYFSEFVIY